MMFDSSAIIFTLIASVVSKWDSNDQFSYGFGRVEIVAGFVNCIALVFAAGSIVVEAIERIYDPVEVSGEKLLLVSVVGLLVNLVGIFAFEHGHAGGDHGGHSHPHSHDHSHSGHQDPLMHGMFLHIVADTLGSVGVITSSLLIQYFGWTFADPLCSLFISALIFMSTWPLLKSSTFSLLQRTPPDIEAKMYLIYKKVFDFGALM
jgi:solute carrier family 30 (zinc transporter), member 5/7